MNLSRSTCNDATMLAPELTAETVNTLSGAVPDIMSGRDLYLDASRLRRLDSSGLGYLVSLMKMTLSMGGAFSITGLTGQPGALIKSLGLTDILCADDTVSRPANRAFTIMQASS